MTKTLTSGDRQVLTRRNIARIDAVLDREGVFAKAFTRMAGKKVEVVGLRIGEKPGHVVALFGDTIVRSTDGRYSVIGGAA